MLIGTKAKPMVVSVEPRKSTWKGIAPAYISCGTGGLKDMSGCICTNVQVKVMDLSARIAAESGRELETLGRTNLVGGTFGHALEQPSFRI